MQRLTALYYSAVLETSKPCHHKSAPPFHAAPSAFELWQLPHLQPSLQQAMSLFACKNQIPHLDCPNIWVHFLSSNCSPVSQISTFEPSHSLAACRVFAIWSGIPLTTLEPISTILGLLLHHRKYLSANPSSWNSMENLLLTLYLIMSWILCSIYWFFPWWKVIGLRKNRRNDEFILQRQNPSMQTSDKVADNGIISAEIKASA